jgi:hypothetical protein
MGGWDQRHAWLVADHDILGSPIDEHTDLPAGLLRQFTEVSCEFMGDNLLGWNLTTVYMLNALYLIGLQTCHIAVYALNTLSSSACTYPVPAVVGATIASATSRAPGTTGTEGIGK